MSSEPPGYFGEDYPPPRPGEPYGPFEGPSLAGPSEALRSRVQLPAIFLIVVAGLNLLGGAYLLFNALLITRTPPEQLAERQSEVYRMLGMAPPADQAPEETKHLILVTQWPWAGLALFGSVLTLLGAIGMLRFRWYGLAVTGSIIAAIPCISCLGCCGVGEGIGIWSLVVLLSEEVRSVFR